VASPIFTAYLTQVAQMRGTRAGLVNPSLYGTLSNSTDLATAARRIDVHLSDRAVLLLDAAWAIGGSPLAAKIYKSSGHAVLDDAALQAARRTAYIPARKNCSATGTYLFEADFNGR